MDTCQKCGSNRVASVQSHGRDCNYVQIGDRSHDGYMPQDMGVGGGDDVYFDFCMDCGQIQGTFPLPPCKLEDTEQ